MNTTTFYENGDTFEITYKRVTEKKPNKNYILIDEILHEVISKEKINITTITDKMSLNVLPGVDEITKQSLILVPSLVKKLMQYNDDYSKQLVLLFNAFLTHKNFEQMIKDYSETNANDDIGHKDRWNLNLRSLLLEVIYPE